MSKIILTGATGLVGGQVLRTAIKDERILEIVVLSRRELPDKSLSENDKVTVLIHKDFQKYPPELIMQLHGATAMIWCIGGMVRDFENAATARKVQVSYVKAAAEAFVEGGLLPLKWVFCSGAWAERDGQKKLWFIEETRKIKGEAESALAALATTHRDFTAYHMRLGGVVPAGKPTAGLPGLVKGEQVAAVFVEVALKGYEKEVLENADIVEFQFEGGKQKSSVAVDAGRRKSILFGRKASVSNGFKG